MKELITINNNIEAEIVEKKSKFIANLYYIENENDVDNLLNSIRKEHYNARHNCYAYRIIDGNSIVERSSDDGEPSGTAGSPMLNILQKNNIVNVLVVVTRYFGGILLGTGGLVKAYSDSMKKALEQAEFMIINLGLEVMVKLSYSELDRAKYFFSNNGIEIFNEEYGEKIKLILNVPKEKATLLDDFCKNNDNILNKKIIKDKLIKVKKP